MDVLSEGCVKKMHIGEVVANPNLQILNIKKIINNKEDKVNRYKLTLGDNHDKINAMIFSMQCKNQSHFLNKGDIGSVIKLDRYEINMISNEVPKAIIGIHTFDVVCKQKSPLSNSSSSKPDECTTDSKIKSFNGCQILSIDKLNLFQNKWSIEVKCYKKIPIKPCPKNPNLNYCIAEFMDSSGKIKIIEFGKDCKKLSGVYENIFYLISDCLVKSANKLYSNPINKYELIITETSVISILKRSIDVVPLSELINKNINDLVDVIGIIKSVQETSFSIGNVAKRVVCILDEQIDSFSVTLWGETTEKFNGVENQVILFKQARLGNYNGKSLNVNNIDQIEINPDMPEARELLHWFNQTRKMSSSEIQIASDLTKTTHEESLDRRLDEDCDQYKSKGYAELLHMPSGKIRIIQAK